MSHDKIIAAIAAANLVLAEIDKDTRNHYVLEVGDTTGVWTRIVRRDIWDGKLVEHSGSAWGFIRNEDLTLWKAAGWKAPAKNKARGVLADLHDPKRVAGWKYSIS